MTDSIVAAAAAARQRVQQRLDRRRCEPRRASRPRPLIAPGAWRVHRGALPLDTIERASRIYIELVERVGSEVQGHGAHAWRASRNYVYGGKRCARTAPPAADIGAAAVADAAEIMAAVFEPLIALLGESIVASTMNGNCVVLDSACGALRSGRTLDARAARTLVAPPWSRFVALLTLLRPFHTAPSPAHRQGTCTTRKRRAARTARRGTAIATIARTTRSLRSRSSCRAARARASPVARSR